MIYTQIVLDTRRKRPSGIYTVKLRVTFNRVQKYYLLGFSMTKTEFEETMRKHALKKYQEQRIQLDHLDLKAKKIIADLDAFSFSLFEEQFYQSGKGGKNLFELYDMTIQSKMENGKVSTAVNYTCSRNSLQKHFPRLTFADVTPVFLRRYERILLAENKSISTVGIYMRPLRAILNEAIERKLLPSSNYPFGKRKYTIPESRNAKKALSREDFKKIIDYIPAVPMSFEERAKDFWLLSYLCQGMNPKDILLLKKECIEEDCLTFIRQKTKHTARNSNTHISVPLLPETKQIIAKWKTVDEDAPYLFDFIKIEMTPLQIYKTVMQFVKMTNKYLKLIAEKVGISKKVTCYTARFQFTKAMIDAGVSTEYIRQCLGHQSTATTQRYIGSFEDSVKRTIAEKYLLNFQ